VSTMEREPADGRTLDLELPATHAAARDARAELDRFARRAGVPEEEMDRLAFVACELLSNAVDHGGGGAAMEASDLRGDVRMRLLVRLHASGWEMEVHDEGGGDPVELEDLLGGGEPDLEDERGRGFFLLANMVDRLQVERRGDARGLVFRAVRGYEPG